MPFRESRNTNTGKQIRMSTKAELFPGESILTVHSPVTTSEIICVMALTLQPIRGCSQHSGETGTRLSSAIHRRLLSRFFLREGGRLYTGYHMSEKPKCLIVTMIYYNLLPLSLSLSLSSLLLLFVANTRRVSPLHFHLY